MLTTPKSLCYGCTACEAICPVDTISMHRDSEDFLYPIVDPTRCIKCNKCNIVCPAQQFIQDRYEQPECYATWNRNERVREKSSSGGIFTLLAQRIIENNGVVCGVAIEEGEVRHIIIDNLEDIAKLRGSKYVQSNVGTCYLEIKKILKAKRYVLFTGTPCQVAGLRNFLRKDSPYLLTADLVCHGVPSPKAWKRYLADQVGSSLPTEINFRAKPQGWNNFHLQLATQNTYYSKPFRADLFMHGFLHDLYSRPVCANCAFTTIQRQGDLSLGDFWGIAEYATELDDDKGTSLILLNSEKAKSYFTSIDESIIKPTRIPLKFASKHNPVLSYPCKHHKNREWFFSLLDNPRYSFQRALDFALTDGAEVAIMNMWWGCNYGANLTGYALQQSLQQLGYSSKLLHYTAGCIPDASYTGSVFEQFAKEMLNTTAKINTFSELSRLNASFDTFIVGSDQVWRYGYTSEADYQYFLDFVHPNKKLIACAASLGSSSVEYPRRMHEKIHCHLSRFDAISVREPDAVTLLEEMFHTKAQWIIDPVFMHDATWWSALADRCTDSLPKGYVARYVLDDSAELQSKIAEQLDGLSCVDAANLHGRKSSVYRWVKIIRDCDYLLTDSFHGMCFALIFRKPFLVLANRARGISRFTFLLESCGLSERLAAEIKDIKRSTLTAALDASDLDSQLAPLVERAKLFLEQSLKQPLQKNHMTYETMLAMENRQALQEISRKLLRFSIYKYKILSRICWGARKHRYLHALNRLLAKY